MGDYKDKYSSSNRGADHPVALQNVLLSLTSRARRIQCCALFGIEVSTAVGMLIL